VTPLLALVTVAAWGIWIPLAQSIPGVPQLVRTFYVTVGSVVLAVVAFVVGGGAVRPDWRHFWLPFAGGLVWTAGTVSSFRATQAVGLARAAGSWTSLNIVTAFVWGAALFGELRGVSAARLAALGASIVLVLAGVVFIARSQDLGRSPPHGTGAGPAAGAPFRRGLLWAVAAGVLWGSYFIPAQWAKVPSQVGNLPLALGILVAGAGLAVPSRRDVTLAPRTAVVLVTAGILFGIGNVALLALVARVGTGVGFTIAQLSLLVNATVGIWVFKVPRPGTHEAHLALAGVLIAGTGGVVIGLVH